MKDERFNMAKALISVGKITTAEELYKVVPMKVIAENLGLNPVSFTNRNAKEFGDFKIKTVDQLAQLLELPIEDVMRLFVNSYQEKRKGTI